MGTEYYIADVAAKRVLYIHKSYWIAGVVGDATIEQMLEAFDDGDPERCCHQPRVRVAVETWVTEFTTGPLTVWSDSQYLEAPFEDERGYLLDGWEGWAAFGTWPGDEPWRPWMGT